MMSPAQKVSSAYPRQRQRGMLGNGLIHIQYILTMLWVCFSHKCSRFSKRQRCALRITTDTMYFSMGLDSKWKATRLDQSFVLWMRQWEIWNSNIFHHKLIHPFTMELTVENHWYNTSVIINGKCSTAFNGSVQNHWVSVVHHFHS